MILVPQTPLVDHAYHPFSPAICILMFLLIQLKDKISYYTL